MSKFSLPKIELSDKQKKTIRALLVALGVIILILVIGLIVGKSPSSPQTTTTDDSGVMVDSPTDQPAQTTKPRTGIFSSLRNLLGGDPANQTTTPNGTTTNNQPMAVEPVGANLDQGQQQQFVDAVRQSQERQRQIDQLREQLRVAQLQLSQYQSALSGQTGATATATQTAITSTQQQIATFQQQIDNAVFANTFISLEMFAYFCYGVPPQNPDPTITLQSVANGTVTIMDAQGNFNTVVCGNLQIFTEQIASWAQSQGYDITQPVFSSIIIHYIQVVSYMYCQPGSISAVCTSFSAIGPNYAQYNGAYNPAAPGYMPVSTFSATGSGFSATGSSYTLFNQVPWQAAANQVSNYIQQVTIQVYVFLEVYIQPFIGAGGLGTQNSYAHQLAARKSSQVFVDVQKTYFESGRFALFGRFAGGGLPIDNLRLTLRYRKRPPQNNQTQQQNNQTQSPVLSVPIQFIVPDSDPLQYGPSITLGAGSWVDFAAYVSGLDPQAIYDFQIVDTQYNIVIN
jgi:hypothetical protein